MASVKLLIFCIISCVLASTLSILFWNGSANVNISHMGANLRLVLGNCLDGLYLTSDVRNVCRSGLGAFLVSFSIVEDLVHFGSDSHDFDLGQYLHHLFLVSTCLSDP